MVMIKLNSFVYLLPDRERIGKIIDISPRYRLNKRYVHRSPTWHPVFGNNDPQPTNYRVLWLDDKSYDWLKGSMLEAISDEDTLALLAISDI